MHIHGIVRSAELVEFERGGEAIDLVLKVQGVGPGQPRTIVVPYLLLLAEADLEPESVVAHAFRAEVVEEKPGRWVTTEIAFANNRVLRAKE